MRWFRRRSQERERSPGRGHILVVDDDPETRVLARTMLERAGFDVSEAIDGAVALERIREKPYSLVLLDLEMPRLGGRALLRKLRGDPVTEDLPVVILTGRTEAQIEELLLREGADGYIRKPLEAEALARHVDHVLSDPPG